MCPAGKTAKKLFVDNFNNGTSSADRWFETHAGVTSDFTERDWTVVGSLPDGRAGNAFFGVDYQGGTCAPGGDESGVMHLDSPVITLPEHGASAARFLRPLGRDRGRLGRRQRQDQRQRRGRGR